MIYHLHGAVDRIENQLEYLQNASRPIAAKTLLSLSERIFRDNCDLLMGVDGQPYFLKGKAVLLSGPSWSEKDKDIVSEAFHSIYQETELLDYLPVGMEHPQLSKIPWPSI